MEFQALHPTRHRVSAQEALFRTQKSDACFDSCFLYRCQKMVSHTVYVPSWCAAVHTTNQSAVDLPSFVCKQSEQNQGLLGVLQASDEQRSRLMFTSDHACRHTDR